MRYLLLFLIICSSCYADQVYNPQENRWETVPANYDNLEYNPHSKEWSNQPDNAEVEYNPHSNTWDWDSGNN